MSIMYGAAAAVILGSVLAGDPLDPGDHLGDSGVDPGVLGLGAPDAPTHDADLLAGAAVRAVKQWTAGVALKRLDSQYFYNGKFFISRVFKKDLCDCLLYSRCRSPCCSRRRRACGW